MATSTSAFGGERTWSREGACAAAADGDHRDVFEMIEQDSIENVNKQVSRTANGRWAPGQSGNAAGRPLAARQRIAEKLLKDLEEVWSECGADVLKKLAITDPKALAQIAYGTLPKEALLAN